MPERLLVQLSSVVLAVAVLTLFTYRQHQEGVQQRAFHVSLAKVEQHVASLEHQQTTILQAVLQQQAMVESLLNLTSVAALRSADTPANASGPVAGSIGALQADAVRLAHARLYDDLRLRLTAQVAALQNPPDCGSARYLACYVNARTCGFGCQLHTLADCMVSALLSERTAVLLPPQLFGYGVECQGLWSCFFLPLSSCHDHVADIDIGLWRSWTADSSHQYTIYDSWGEDPYRVPAALHALAEGSFAALDPVPPPACLLAGVVLRWCMRPSERVQAVCQRRAEALGLRRAPADVGLHVRRTDKARDGEARAYDLRHYVMHVDRLLRPRSYHHGAYRQRPGKRVLAMSDSDLHQEVSAFAAYDWTLAVASRQDRWTRDALDLLICDVHSLAVLPYFVGTLSSHISRLVAELRAAGPGAAAAFATMLSLDEAYYRGREPGQARPTSLRPATDLPIVQT
eukprot:EG_transcript_8305